jgi:hypothetical protein
VKRSLVCWRRVTAFILFLIQPMTLTAQLAQSLPDTITSAAVMTCLSHYNHTECVCNNVAITINDVQLRSFIEKVAQPRLEGNDISNELLQCYLVLKQGKTSFNAQDLVAIIPELLEFVRACELSDHDTSGRTEPHSTGSDAEYYSALHRLLELLDESLSEKDQQMLSEPSFSDAWLQLYRMCNENPTYISPQVIIADIFCAQDTITALMATYNNSGTACCLGTFTSLAALNTTLTNCCNGTFTALAALNTTMTTDFNGTFTVLALHTADFIGTFTVLAALNTTITTDFNGTFTTLASISTCCNSTFTVLAALNTTITTDFNGTFTALAALNTTLTNCCNGTFTALAALNTTMTTDFNGTFTVLALHTADFAGTFTVLAALNTTITTDFNGTFTALAALNTTLTNCCNGTFTALAALNTTVTTDFNGTFTVLALHTADFAGTFTVLAALNTTITTDFNGTFTALAAMCNRTTITASLQILSAGSYCLSQNVVGAITIGANDVTLDLNGYTINGGTNGIVVNSGVAGTMIKNGSVINTTGEGIVINSGCKGGMLDTVIIMNCCTSSGQFGLHLLGTAASLVDSFMINNVMVIGGRSGIALEDVSNIKVQNSMVTDSFQNGTTSVLGIRVAGVNGGTSTDIELLNCFVTNLTSTSTSCWGFDINQVNNIVLDTCMTTSISSASDGVGISVQNTTNINIINSKLEGLQSTAGTAGIYMQNNSSNFFIGNTQIIGVKGSGTRADGIRIIDTPNGIIDSCVVISVTASSGDAVAFNIFRSASPIVMQNVIVKNSSASSILSTGQNKGIAFRLEGNNMICRECLATSITADNACSGFASNALQSSGPSNIDFYDCDCANLLLTTTTFSAGAALESGNYLQAFQLSSNSGGAYRCKVTTINGPNGGNISGFWIDPNYATNIVIDECRIVTATATSAHGFYIQAPGTVVKNCIAESCGFDGFNLAPTATASVLDYCISSSMMLTALGGGIGFTISSPEPYLYACIANNCLTNGFNITTTANAAVLDSCIANVITATAAAGFNVYASGVVFRNCTANGGAQGYNIQSTAQNTFLDYCISSSILSATGQSFNIAGPGTACSNCFSNIAGAEGFQVLSTATGAMFDTCRTFSTIISSGIGFSIAAPSAFLFECAAESCGSFGYQVVSTGTGSVLDHCRAMNCKTGISIVTGFNIKVGECVASNNNLTNYSSGVANVVAQGGTYVIGANLSL